jgi:parallel beta-helix repeat protein
VKIKKTFLSPSCIILFLLFGVVLTSSPALAADKTVCASGCDQTTIQAGIDDAFDDVPSGGTVTVTDSRTYTECITMKDGVNVISSVGETPTIDCTTAYTATVTFENGISCNLDGFDITHSSGDGAGVAVDGLSGTVTTTISNCTIHNIANSGGIRMNGVVDCTITGNTIYDCGKGGISVGDVTTTDDVQGGSSITIKDNTIGDNTDPYTETNIEAGIYLKGSGSVTVDIGTVAEPNTICNNGEAGIRLDTITDLTIDSNTINNNTKGGILLIDVGSGSGDAIVQNNDIYDNSKAGINIGGASYLTIGDNNTIDNNYAGVVFNMGDVVESPGSASSGPVKITRNDINTNSWSGIGIIDAITNTVTITDQNDIHDNTRAGIGIQNNCRLVITKNTIRGNDRGGIHTGTDSDDPGGFSGTAGSADLTIKQNKVYGNGETDYGSGIDVRHATGTIYNNLVYENHRGGIRFGDWIDEIINNTVADNGDAINDQGGGIIYDDISAGDGVNDPPAGDPPAALDIRNNICAYNQKAGIRACFTNTPGSEERDYNLVYSNNGTGATDCGWYTDSGISYVTVGNFGCANKQFGGCGADFSGPPHALEGPHDIISNPEFENRAADDYRIKSTSPAVDAGDTSYGIDVSIPPGVGTLIIDMGAYGGPDGINWP